MEAGGISDIEAGEMLSKYGLLDKDLDDERRIAFYNAVTSAFDRFSIEIQRTIDYLSTVQKMGAVESICTLGFVNRIKGIDAYLSKMFSLKANKVETQKMIEFDDDVDFSLIDKMLYFDICVGAGVRSVK
jgi:Tfp pilus assembly PilM family ATPase